MLFTESEEFGVSKGLGIIKGRVKSLNTFNKKMKEFLMLDGDL